jgi:hypothetical protein
MGWAAPMAGLQNTLDVPTPRETQVIPEMKPIQANSPSCLSQGIS